MTQPATRIRSEFPTSNVAVKWVKGVEAAPDDNAALLQMLYFQTLQIRAIKLVLIWTLVVLPIVFAIGFIVLAQAIPSDPTSF